MSARLRSESGQALLVTVLFLGALLGAVTLTLDVGVWFREQRQAQATADAAALAGAQALPTSTAQATANAQTYGTANGGGLTGIAFRTDNQPNDTVVVNVHRNPPGFFAQIFHIASVDVHATAAARAGVPDQVSGVAPIVVNKLHPMLSGPGCPCFHDETTIPLGKDGAPGAFGLINLDPNASNGVPNLDNWVQYGYDGYLARGPYNSDPGAKFNSNEIRSALSARLGTELLFPVYDTLTGNGSNAAYNVIGWVAFHLDAFDVDHGNTQTLTGYFTRVIWDGIQSSSNKHLPDFGVYSVSLVN